MCLWMGEDALNREEKREWEWTRTERTERDEKRREREREVKERRTKKKKILISLIQFIWSSSSSSSCASSSSSRSSIIDQHPLIFILFILSSSMGRWLFPLICDFCFRVFVNVSECPAFPVLVVWRRRNGRKWRGEEMIWMKNIRMIGSGWSWDGVDV